MHTAVPHQHPAAGVGCERTVQPAPMPGPCIALREFGGHTGIAEQGVDVPVARQYPVAKRHLQHRLGLPKPQVMRVWVLSEFRVEGVVEHDCIGLGHEAMRHAEASAGHSHCKTPPSRESVGACGANAGP